MIAFLFLTILCILLYIYVGYPILLFFISFFVGKRYQVEGCRLFTVSLIISAYNEEMIILKKLENSLEIDYPADKLEILVGSDGSLDKTNDIVRNFPSRRIIFFEWAQRRGKVNVVNDLVSQAQGEIIVFTDANTLIEKSAFKKLLKHFSSESVGAVSGDVILKDNNLSKALSESAYYKLERNIQKFESKIDSIIGVDGGLFAIRKNIFVSPSANIILDDFVVSMHVLNKGYRVIYEPEAIGYEKPPRTFPDQLRRRIRVARGCFQTLFQKEGLLVSNSIVLNWEYISHKLFRWSSPFFLIILFLSNLLLVAQGYYKTFFFLQVIFYIFAFIGKYVSFWIFSIPFIFCLANYAILKGFWSYFSTKSSAIWDPVR